MANPALIDELEKQFRDNPRRVFARLANEYRKAGDFMRAIEICHAHVPQQPGYISGHVVLGQALYDAGELEQAHQTFQTALTLDPENLIALRQLGDIARDRREYGDARSWYTRLLEIDPQNDDVVAQLGELSLVEGAPAAAVSGAELNGKHETSTGAGATVEPEVEEAPSDEVVAVADLAPAEDAPTPVAEADEDETADEREPVSDAEATSEEPASLSAAPWWTASDRQATDEASETPATPGEVTMLDEGGVYEGDDLTPALEPDDDVAWIAAERIDVESTAFTILDATEQAGNDTAPPPLELMDDLDFTFETEEPETTLEMHDGESLSIISEEDPLAGVQPVHNADPSPFGVNFERPASEAPDASLESDVSFEPLPISEIDAASDEGTVESGAGEPEVPASPWMEAEPSPAVTPGFEAIAEPAPDALELSDAETLVDEPAAPSWSEPAATIEPDAAEREDPAHESMPWWEASTPSTPDVVETDEQATQSAPWWEVVPPPEPEPVAAAAVPDEPPAGSPEPDADLLGEEEAEATFVTETMAELYLQQGFRQEALDVYRRLAEQSPDDAALQERIARLERSDAAAEADPGAAASAQSRSAASFFKSLASVRPTPPSSTGATKPGQSGWEAATLSGAGAVDPSDDEAAAALSKGFATEPPAPAPPASEQPRSAIRAADRDMSLHDIFGASQPDKEGEPSGSMDAFFTPDGERAGGTETGGGDDDDDIEAFNAWLEGLKK